MGDKGTNKRAKYQTCLSIFEREYLRDDSLNVTIK